MGDPRKLVMWHFRAFTVVNSFSTSTLCGMPIVLTGSQYCTAEPRNIEFDREDNCQKCALLLHVAKVNGFDPKGPDIEDQLESVMGRVRV